MSKNKKDKEYIHIKITRRFLNICKNILTGLFFIYLLFSLHLTIVNSHVQLINDYGYIWKFGFSILLLGVFLSLLFLAGFFIVNCDDYDST